MSTQRYSPDSTVAETLAPDDVAEVFTRHHTACVGCYLARFCTLREVAADYNLPLEDLLEELRRAALAKTRLLTGANHDK